MYTPLDIRQSAHYAEYVRSIGWRVEKIGRWHSFIKPLPIVGSFIKIQRVTQPFPWNEIKILTTKYHAYTVIIEPASDLNASKLQIANFKLLNSPYLPTKTIHINLQLSEKQLFNHFTESKRRAVRRAIKNNVVITESNDIKSFINLKTKNMINKLLEKNNLGALWQSFRPSHSTLLFATSQNSEHDSGSKKPLAAIFLLFHQKTAHYWLATSTKRGKKMFAPTLLVWEALKLSKKRGCTLFDFEGIYDERFSEAFADWKGFTKFKQGFGGKEIEYPKPLILK